MEKTGFNQKGLALGAKAKTPRTSRVSISITKYFAVMAADLAAARNIDAAQFTASILNEGLYEAFLEMEAQKNALLRSSIRTSPYKWRRANKVTAADEDR
jgi:hypothetical protein